jgi:outer membrane protein assembly factor BamD (BamD/ComL family)
MHGGSVFRIIGIAMVSLAWMAGPVGAVDDDDGPKERMVYDPATGRWIEEAPPEPGTERGDLELAKRIMAGGDKGDGEKARKALEDWIKTYGEASDLYGEALFAMADARFLEESYIKAHEHYQEYINEFPGTALEERAWRREFVIAEVFLSGRKKKTWGMRLFKAEDEAIDILDQLAVENPKTLLAEQAIKTKADFYYRTGEFELAEEEYARLTREFPNSRYARLAMLQSARSALASFPGVEFDDAPLIEAEERFVQFQSQYPRFASQQRVGVVLDDISNTRAHKEYVIGEYYERTDSIRSAVFYYRSVMTHWPDSTWASLAAGRLEGLGFGVLGDASTAALNAPDDGEAGP